MRRLPLIAGAGVGIVLLAAAIVPFLVPNSVYKVQIEKAATTALGRKVTLEGDVGLSIFPQISASINGVTVANPEGFSRDNMVEAGSLRGVVRWAPLLSRRVEVAEISFVDADVMLERRADGAVNWELGSAPAEPPEGGEEQTGAGVDASIDRARLENARLVYDDAVSGTRYEVSELDLSAGLQGLDAPLNAEASGLFQGARFSIDLRLDTPETLLGGLPAELGLDVDTDGASVSYDGSMTLAETTLLDGAFTVDGRNLTELATLAGADVPINLASLGRLVATGSVSGSIEEADVQFERLSLGGSGLDGVYTGAVSLGDTIRLDGALDLDSANLGRWLSGLGLDLPETVSVLERVDFSSGLSGPVDGLSLRQTSLSHRGRLLTADFNGTAQLGGASRLDGRLAASSSDLRALLAALDIEVEEGETLETFSVSGALDGTLSRIAIANLDARLDDIAATGDLDLNLSGPRPALTGNLVTQTLDLSPFLKEGDEPARKEPGGWSDAVLDLSGLRAVDTEVSLKAERIVLGNITLGAPDLSVDLDAGALTARIASMRAFGGQWSGAFGLDARGETAAVDIDLTGETIQLNDALLSLAGLDALSGVGQLNVDVSSSGNSLKALVEGLSGELGTSVANGSVKGVNVGQLVRSRESLLQALANGTLQMALAPEAETDFTSLLAGLSLQNGVASVDQFSLVNPVLSLQGSGSINLGARTLDVGIVPRLDTSGQAGGSALQLNGVPIPFRIQGDWLSPRLTPDTQLVQSILRQDAQNRARDAIEDEIGEELGGLLDGVLGPRRPQSTTPTTPPATTDPDEANPPAEQQPVEAPAAPAQRNPEQVVEELARDAARNALGDLLGNRRNRGETPTEPPPPQEPEPEPTETTDPQ